MSIPWTIAIVLAVAMGAFAAGRVTGHHAGVESQRATHLAETVEELEAIISSSASLILQANKASAAMRASLVRLDAEQRETTKELKDVLFQTRGDRMLCRFDDDSLRIVRQARERAASAAASGIRGALPATAGDER